MSETDPLIERNDDDDDEEEVNPFRPDSSPTPGPSGEDIPLTTMNREKEKEPTTAETSFIEGSPVSRVLTSNRRAWEALKRIFPGAKATDIDVSYSKKGRLQVKMFGQGKKAYDLYTVQRGTKVERLNPNLPKEIRKALGTEREVLISTKEKDIQELQKSIREDQIIVEDENENQQVRNRAREIIAVKQEQIDALENEREEL